MTGFRITGVLVALAIVVAGGVLLVLRPWAHDDATADAPEVMATTEGTILAVGDIGRCDEEVDEATAAIVERFADAPLLVLGDVAYNRGSAEDFQDCYDPSWGRFADRTRPVPGNHEYRTDGAGPYFDYFGDMAGEPGKGWYSFEVGDWKIVALNSNCDHVDCRAGSEQERWLRAELEASGARCTLAFSHHPRFSSGDHGDTKDVADLWRALLDHDVEVLLSGHDHNYERTAPLDARGRVDQQSGVRQFVVGTGGGNFYELKEPLAGSESTVTDTGGVLRMNLHGSGYEWEFIPVGSGAALDTGSAECR